MFLNVTELLCQKYFKINAIIILYSNNEGMNILRISVRQKNRYSRVRLENENQIQNGFKNEIIVIDCWTDLTFFHIFVVPVKGRHKNLSVRRLKC